MSRGLRPLSMTGKYRKIAAADWRLCAPPAAFDRQILKVMRRKKEAARRADMGSARCL